MTPEEAYTIFRGSVRAGVPAPPHWLDLSVMEREALKVVFNLAIISTVGGALKLNGGPGGDY